ncbi:MAG: hypothetical protein E7311_06250 [Clostridiales bacterium]|nr:hypothetical protein [Clostridiales bacterium]
MNKKLLSVCIVCIIISISGFLLIRQYPKNKSFSNHVDATKLEKMKDSKLADLFYNISKDDGFVTEKEKDYSFPYNCAASVEDAIEKTKTIGQSSNTKILELKLLEETDYYYIIYQEYVSYRESGDVTYKNSYLYFKNSILDIDNKTINTNILNSANKVKEIFNLYTYIRNNANSSIKLLLPEITENPNEYIYTYYYFNTSYGDWGLSDTITLYKNTVSINKQTGKFESIENQIRQVSGKTNNY